MKNRIFPAFAALYIVLAALPVLCQTTTVTYQGSLQFGGAPTEGYYDFVFVLYNNPSIGSPVGPALTNLTVPVANGLFTVTNDFGSAPWNGQNLWMQILVRTNGTVAFTSLSPRQPITSAPYAIESLNAATASTVAATNLSGTLLNSTLPPGPSFSGTVTAGSFTGNGANLTNVNALTLNGLNSANFWQLGGNTVNSSQFLGSTNNQPVKITVNSIRGLMIATNPADSANIIGGAQANTIDLGVEGAVISGGGTTNFEGTTSSNRLSANFTGIGSGSGNWVQSGADHSFIGGGWNNVIATSAYESFIGGGNNNTNTGQWSVIAGGLGNISGGYVATTGGGMNNTNEVNIGVLAGGQNNALLQPGSSPVYQPSIGGGYDNIVTNSYATIPGGAGNLAGGEYSLAAGREAQALHQGALVWADSQNAAFASTSNDQFSVRAQGGARFVTSGAGMTLDGASVLTVSSSAFGFQIQENTNGAPNVIAGSPVNYVSNGVIGATIAGGGQTNVNGVAFSNSVTANFGTIGGE